jgi:DNA end-binding protein Ku
MPAPTSSRTLWKGAISFGWSTSRSRCTRRRREPHEVQPARQGQHGPGGQPPGQQGDRRSHGAGEIVKGFEVEKDQYVVLTPDEIKAALPTSTQTIEIEAFVDREQIPTSTSTSRIT